MKRFLLHRRKCFRHIVHSVCTTKGAAVVKAVPLSGSPAGCAVFFE
ncbi:hypothetical protein BSM4216_2405 [Bacillus smithii]|nr:hypothetical protein BSM4216_2405 [Bacillus smithii]